MIDSAGGTTSYVANNNNQYSFAGGNPLGYDGRGNTTSFSGTTFAYNAENELLQAAASSFVYDAYGRCVKRSDNAGTTYLVYGQNWDVIAEYNVSGVQQARYVQGADVDEILTKTDSAGASVYYHTDQLGSITKLTSSTGQLLEQYSYDVFGTPTIQSSSGSSLSSSAYGNRFLFTGREYLSSLNVYDYRQRDYSPQLGRFLQADPVGHEGDLFNLYRYCGNNPVNGTDPSGLDDFVYTTFENFDWLTGTYTWGYSWTYTDNFGNVCGDRWTSTSLTSSHEIPYAPTPTGDALIAPQIVTALPSDSTSLLPPNALPVVSTPAASSKGIGEPSLIASIIPVYGTGRSAINAFQTGHPYLGVFYSVLTVVDVATLGSDSLVTGIAKLAVRESTELAAKTAVKEGIYEFVSETGEIYVGQSGRIGERLFKDHLGGKLLPENIHTIKVREVLGGKTAREIQEQIRINELGGIGKLRNERNAIGPTRQHLMP
jgi:RHS repeat-associated protein